MSRINDSEEWAIADELDFQLHCAAEELEESDTADAPGLPPGVEKAIAEKGYANQTLWADGSGWQNRALAQGVNTMTKFDPESHNKRIADAAALISQDTETARPFELEISRTGRPMKFVLDGHDLTLATRAVEVHAPAGGPAEITVKLANPLPAKGQSVIQGSARVKNAELSAAVGNLLGGPSQPAEDKQPYVPTLLRLTRLEADSTQDEAAQFRFIDHTGEPTHMVVIINPRLVPTAEEQAAYRRRGALRLALILAQQADPEWENIDDHLYRLEEFFAHANPAVTLEHLPAEESEFEKAAQIIAHAVNCFTDVVIKLAGGQP